MTGNEHISNPKSQLKKEKKKSGILWKKIPLKISAFRIYATLCQKLNFCLSLMKNLLLLAHKNDSREHHIPKGLLGPKASIILDKVTFHHGKIASFNLVFYA